MTRFSSAIVLAAACVMTLGADQVQPEARSGNQPPSIHIPITGPLPPRQAPLIVHEWGTFTSLQDEAGQSIGGINVDDEPVPPFVHRIGPALTGQGDGSKGFAPAHPDVTMRLETPVIYFYPADNKPMTLDVSATFNGGLLTEFYPKANITYDGKPSLHPPDSINANTRGGLEWHDVSVHLLPPPVVSCAPAATGPVGPPEAPVTDSRVWLAPRAVNAMPVTVGKEAEHYLFYRGVGHLDAPIRVVRSGSAAHNVIQIYDNRPMDRPLPPMNLGGMWLADFRADGSCAFRTITDAPASPLANIRGQKANFADPDYAIENVDKLKDAMKRSLQVAGLFEDEATAMLETWKLSYFKSNGQRLFFLVPREWTDSVLPLQISQKCELTRVMMGRIELITPEKRAAAKQLVEFQRKPSPLSISGELRSKLTASLGRFADAIVADEMHRSASASHVEVTR